MIRLTKPSPHGKGCSIASGDLGKAITKLGMIEANTEDLIGEACDGYCKHLDALDEECYAEQLEAICKSCPLSKIIDMVYGEE